MIFLVCLGESRGRKLGLGFCAHFDLIFVHCLWLRELQFGPEKEKEKEKNKETRKWYDLGPEIGVNKRQRGGWPCSSESEYLYLYRGSAAG